MGPRSGPSHSFCACFIIQRYRYPFQETFPELSNSGSPPAEPGVSLMTMSARAATSLCHVAALGLTGLAITMNTHAPSERILFDFQASTNSSAWQIVNDDVMGGVSTSRFQILTNGGAVFSGVVLLENNGGFASVRSSPARHDLTGCGGFVIRLRATDAVTNSPRARKQDSTRRFTSAPS